MEPERGRKQNINRAEAARALGPGPRLPAARLPAPHAHDGGPGPPAPPRARVDAGLIYYSPAWSCGFPVLKIPRTRNEGYSFLAVTPPFSQQGR